LELHAEQLGVIPRLKDISQDNFIDKILNSNCHVITTVRRKTDYSLDKDGKGTKVMKLGTKEITRDGFEYEPTVNFDL
jgi:hypothetical protein